MTNDGACGRVWRRCIHGIHGGDGWHAWLVINYSVEFCLLASMYCNITCVCMRKCICAGIYFGNAHLNTLSESACWSLTLQVVCWFVPLGLLWPVATQLCRHVARLLGRVNSTASLCTDPSCCSCGRREPWTDDWETAGRLLSESSRQPFPGWQNCY